MKFRTLARRAALSAICAACAMPLATAHAQAAWPSRPITLVVPQAAGGTNDIAGRLVAQKLGELLGGSAVVDNRPGAGGNIGTQLVARAPKDGYTLLMTISSSQAINPALYRNPGFDPVKDFVPIGLVGSVPNVLLVNPAFPARDLPSFLAAARAPDTHYQYASAGNGTLNHLLGEMLNSMAGLKLQHVPYKGVAPAMNDVVGGQLPILFGSLPSALPHIKAGKLRAIAVSGARRSPALPEVPAIAEAMPGYAGTLWIGLFAPAGTPPEVTARLQQAMARAMAAPDLRAKLEQQGVEIAEATPAQFAQLLRDDLVKWAAIVKSSGAAID
ncbi:MAG: tripartite tricarboxylate transporter substrate binding protein [Xenophilus sp.]